MLKQSATKDAWKERQIQFSEIFDSVLATFFKMKGNLCGAGLKWSSLYAHNTTFDTKDLCNRV